MTWAPKGNLLAGSTVQGTIIIWDVSKSKEVARYQHHTKPSFCVAWSKLDANLLVSTSSDGNAVVFELIDGTIKEAVEGEVFGSAGLRRNVSKTPFVMKFAHPAPVFGCAWSPFKSKVFCTGSQDGHVRVFDCNLGTLPLYTLAGHNARVFNIVWSPLVPTLLASGSDDLSVLVWNVEGLSPGESGKVVKPKCALYGHSGNVRALSWNYEHKDILLSGSWDRTIRLWDTVNAICLKVISDHAADVYSLVSHPSRPFAYLSCSRDSTVRLWELDAVASHLKVVAMLDESFERVRDVSAENSEEIHSPSPSPQGHQDGYFHEDLTDIKAESPNKQKIPLTISTVSTSPQGLLRKNAADALPAASRASPLPAIHSPSVPKKSPFSFTSSSVFSKSPPSIETVKKPPSETKLSTDKMFSPLPQLIQGKESARICGNLAKLNAADAQNNEWIKSFRKAEKYYHIFSLFSGSTATLDLWEAALSHIRSLIPRDLAGASNVMQATSRAKESIKVLFQGDLLSTARSDAKKLEAIKMSKHGTLSSKVIDKLQEAAMIYARVGDFEKYCELMLNLGEWTKALAMAPRVSIEYWEKLCRQYAEVMDEKSNEECIPFYMAIGGYDRAVEFYLSKNEQRNALLVVKAGREITKSDYLPHPQRERPPNTAEDALMQRVAWSITQKDILSGNCIAGAAQYLAVTGDHDAAIQILSTCYEDELAFALASCFDADMTDVTRLLAYKCARRGMVSVAIELMTRIAAPPLALGLLLSYACRTEEQAGRFVAAHELKSMQHWSRLAEDGGEEPANQIIAHLVCARDFTRACKTAISFLKPQVRETLDADSMVMSVVNSMKHAQLHEIEGQLRTQILHLLLWFSSFEAAKSANYLIAANMIRILRASSFFLSSADLLIQVSHRP